MNDMEILPSIDLVERVTPSTGKRRVDGRTAGLLREH